MSSGGTNEAYQKRTASRKPSLPRTVTRHMVLSLALTDSEHVGKVAKRVALNTYISYNILGFDSKKQYAQALDLASALRITPFV